MEKQTETKETKKNTHKVMVIISLFVLLIIILFFLFITFTPPGSMPYPLNIYKFKKACPEATFWLKYDEDHIVDIESTNFVFIEKSATVRYLAKPNTYDSSEVIKYAENNGWFFREEEQLDEIVLNKYDINSPRTPFLIIEYNKSCMSGESCHALIFKTENQEGVPSFIYVSSDKSKMEVRYADPVSLIPAPG